MAKRQDAFILKLHELTSKRPKLLLHACCAPCSTHVLDLLYQSFEIGVFFYNPNIYPKQEHDRRLDELKTFIFKYYRDLKLYSVDYAPQEFYSAARGLENCPERGPRCAACYRLRLSKTAEYGIEQGYEYFTTTLSVSPHKDAALLNKTGASLLSGINYLDADFKKRDGYLKSVRLSAFYGLYRQKYCGCEYSMDNSSPGRRQSK